jgi:ubiquinone/menaquinone biosynthesis C-methylase UbiE
VAAAAEKLRAYARAIGRAPEAVAVTVRTGLRADDDPDAVLERMRQYKQAGVSHLCLETSFRDPARAYAALERFAREVRARL